MKPHRLYIDNAAEDVPRCMAAAGKACDGSFTLVLRPTDEQHILHFTKGRESLVWMAKGGTDSVPAMPTEAMPAREAVALVKARGRVDKTLGPITFRSQWKGHVTCSDGGPDIVLERKVSAYVSVAISTAAGSRRWHWKVTRTGQWFTGPAQRTGAEHSLGEAMRKVLSVAVSTAGEACGVRDTGRRAARDPEYAKTKPVRPAKTGKDPVQRLKEPPAPKAPKAAPARKPPKAPDRDIPSGVPGVVYEASVGGYSPGDWAAYRGDEGQVVSVAPSKGQVKWRSTGGKDSWVSPEALSYIGKERPSFPRANPVAVMRVGDSDAAKDKALMGLFSNALRDALA